MLKTERILSAFEFELGLCEKKSNTENSFYLNKDVNEAFLGVFDI